MHIRHWLAALALLATAAGAGCSIEVYGTLGGCSGSTDNACIAVAPRSWEGPLLIRTNHFGEGGPLAPCADGIGAEQLFLGPTQGVECSECSCGALLGGACLPGVLSCHEQTSACVGPGIPLSIDAQDPSKNPCFTLSDSAILDDTTSRSCRMLSASTLAQKGSCEPSI